MYRQQCNLLDKSLFNELNNIQYLGQINDSKEIMKALQQYIEQHPNSVFIDFEHKPIFHQIEVLVQSNSVTTTVGIQYSKCISIQS